MAGTVTCIADSLNRRTQYTGDLVTRPAATQPTGTVALSISYEVLFSVDGLIDSDEKVASSKKYTQFITKVLKSSPV